MSARKASPARWTGGPMSSSPAAASAAPGRGAGMEGGGGGRGGLFSEWQRVQGWERIGYPVIDGADDGSFVLSKPQGSGGLIHPAAVAEQILYEVGDPGAYLMPDVT